MKCEKVFDNKVLYIDDEYRVEYKFGKILFKRNGDNQIVQTFSFSNLLADKIFSSIPVTERLFRYEPRFIDRISKTDFLVSEHGSLSMISIESGNREEIFTYANGTNNPLCFCSCQHNGKWEIVFGDYGGCDENNNIGIYRYSDKRVTKISSISRNLINHIHRIEYDSYEDCYWVFTGDTDIGSGIWRLDDSTCKTHLFLNGSQQYRTCVAFINRRNILYASDSPNDFNHIYLLDKKTREIKMIADMPGSCIYGNKIEYADEEIYFFATAVEPDSNLPTIRYRFSGKLGAGIYDRYTHLIAGNERLGFKEVWKSKKDWMPMWLFQFGNIRFPTQRIKGLLYFCPQSCVDHGTYMLRL